MAEYLSQADMEEVLDEITAKNALLVRQLAAAQERVRRLEALADPLGTLERLVTRYTTPDMGAFCQLNWQDGVVSVLWVKGPFDEAPRFHYHATPGKHGAGETDREEAAALLAAELVKVKE